MDPDDCKPYRFTECPGIDDEAAEKKPPVVGSEFAFVSYPDTPDALEKGLDPGGIDLGCVFLPVGLQECDAPLIINPGRV